MALHVGTGRRTVRPAAPAARVPAAERPARRRRQRAISPLTVRILAINVLALAILVAGVLYLGRYQDRLIQAELDGLRSEARIFASALAEGALASGPDETRELSPDLARSMVHRLVETTDTRTRLFDGTGTLLVDSRVATGPGGIVQIEEMPPPYDSALAKFGSDLYDAVFGTVPRRKALPVYHEAATQSAGDYPDVARALDGDVSASVWALDEKGGGGLMLTAAVPIQSLKQVLGAVLLSRPGTTIDQAMRSVRSDILRVCAVALGVTVLLSLYLANTIARPIRRLAAAAERVRRGHGRRGEIPDFTHRRDEIGDLSGVLREMIGALWARMDAIERFAADVAHEIKNPLTSLRSAVETAARVRDPERQRQLMSIIEDDVQRLDRLISDISNASRLDAELSRAESEPVDVEPMLRALVGVHETTTGQGAPRLKLRIEGGAPWVVLGLEGRLVQVFQNLVVNALSFSPPGGTVTLSMRRAGHVVEVTVEDEGPGIPEGKLEAIFDRFYTERPAGEKFGTHSGLGLSISKQIVEAHGGRIFATNRQRADGTAGGAVFTVRLPVAG